MPLYILPRSHCIGPQAVALRLATRSKDFISVLQQLHQRLKQQLEDKEAEVAELREKITRLWVRLPEEFRHREDFFSTHRDHCSATLEAVCITSVL